MNKYKNEKCVYNEIEFDSKLELEFYKELQSRGFIFFIQEKFFLQEGYTIGDRKERPITYVADFHIPSLDMVIDTKGLVKPIDVIKKKLFEYKFDKELIFITKCPKKYKDKNTSYFSPNWIEIKELSKFKKSSKKSVLGGI